MQVLDYKLDAYESLKQARGDSGESLLMCMTWRDPDASQFFTYCPKLEALGDWLLQMFQLLAVQKVQIKTFTVGM